MELYPFYQSEYPCASLSRSLARSLVDKSATLQGRLPAVDPFVCETRQDQEDDNDDDDGNAHTNVASTHNLEGQTVPLVADHMVWLFASTA